MKVAVAGAGAIGAHVGVALHRAGAEVHLIARGPHLAAMRRDGVRVLSPRGDFTARPAATDDPSDVGPADYVFLGLKANSYAMPGPLVHPLMHGRTVLIAAQNGELDVLLAAVVEPASLTGTPVPTLRAVHALAGLLATTSSAPAGSAP